MKVFRHICCIAVSIAGISVSPVKVYRLMADLATGISIDIMYAVFIALLILGLAFLFLLYSKEFVAKIRTIAGLTRISQGNPFGPFPPY